MENTFKSFIAVNPILGSDGKYDYNQVILAELGYASLSSDKIVVNPDKDVITLNTAHDYKIHHLSGLIDLDKLKQDSKGSTIDWSLTCMLAFEELFNHVISTYKLDEVSIEKILPIENTEKIEESLNKKLIKYKLFLTDNKVSPDGKKMTASELINYIDTNFSLDWSDDEVFNLYSRLIDLFNTGKNTIGELYSSVYAHVTANNH